MTVAINPNLKGKARTKAIRTQQRRIIREVLKYGKATALACVDNLPLEWDGWELRWLLSGILNQNVLHPDKKKRRRDFDNECIIRNLPS